MGILNIRYSVKLSAAFGLFTLTMWAVLFGWFALLAWRESFALPTERALFGFLLVLAITAEWRWKKPGAALVASMLRWLIVAVALFWIDQEFFTYHLIREPFPPESIVTELPRAIGDPITLSPFDSGLHTMRDAIDARLMSAKLPVLLLAFQVAAAGILRRGYPHWPVFERERTDRALEADA